MIDIVVVDLGGVACRFLPQRRLRALSSMSGLAPEIIESRLFASGLDQRLELGAFSPEEALRAVGAALDYRIPRTEIIDAWALAFEPDIGVLECLESLSVRRALFTNNGPLIDSCLARSLRRVEAPFAEIICSWHIRSRKPDAVAFQRAADRLRSAPQQLLLLDDSEENVGAASACGWQADCVGSAEEVLLSLESRDLIVRWRL